MGIPTLNKNYIAETAIKKCRIVAFGSSEGRVIHATSATEKSMGISMELDADLGDRVDVTRAGIADVEYGGNVAAGDELTADAEGRAVVAAPGAGSNVRIVGIAEYDGVLGDIGAALIGCGSMQG